MENPEFAAQLLPRARELGAGIALDDFGSGYTSLGEIERYHFDTLKIGAALARPRGGTGRSVVLRAAVAMAHDLGMDVIADGADNESDAVELVATRLRVRRRARLRPADDGRAGAQADGRRAGLGAATRTAPGPPTPSP